MALPEPNPKAITKTDANGNLIYLTDPNGNEITSKGKKTAGFILVFATVLTALVLIAHWPDKMPPNEGSGTCTKYQYKWFAINYLGTNGKGTGDTVINISTSSLIRTKSDSTVIDTIVIFEENADSLFPGTDTPANAKASVKTLKVNKQIVKAACKKSCTRTIDLNTLILLLVAIAGFLGNMIHIASSFTNFIGAGKFKRSWMMWYWVKPFTAAALAVGVYIIFRAGFLNSAEASVNVNLYGVVAIALLAGLFTDMATQKLKEIFGVVFQSSTVRPNPLEYPPVKITSTNPKSLPLNKEAAIVLSGIGFDSRTLKFTIDGEEITGAVIQPNSIAFTYKATKEKPQLIVYDEKGVELLKYDLIATDETAIPAPIVTVTGIAPASFPVNTATEITIDGTGLDTAELVIKVADAEIPNANISISTTAVKFNYTAATVGPISIVVIDDKATELYNGELTVE